MTNKTSALSPDAIPDERDDYVDSEPSKRMPILGTDALARTVLTAPQRAMWEAVAGSARAHTAIREAGQLTGPFDVLLRSPEIGLAFAKLGERLRFEGGLEPHELELVIIAVAGHWKARYSWLRHAFYARRSGVSAEILAAIAGGAEPTFDSSRDSALYDFALQLVRAGNVSDQQYEGMLALVGERKLVDIVTLVGYYSMSSFILNVFDVPLPVGERAPWDIPSA